MRNAIALLGSPAFVLVITRQANTAEVVRTYLITSGEFLLPINAAKKGMTSTKRPKQINLILMTAIKEKLSRA